MNFEAILGVIAGVASFGGLGMLMFKRFIKKTDEVSKEVGKNSTRITVLEQNSVTSKQLEEAFDKTIVPLVAKIDDTMVEVRKMKTDHIIEAKARAMADQMFKDQS